MSTPVDPKELIVEHDEPIILTPLIADLWSASLAQTQVVTNTLIESLTEQVAYERARSAAVDFDIRTLLGGNYMPTPAALLRALYPSDDYIESFRDRSET